MNEISLEYLISDFSIFEKANMIRRVSDIHNKEVNAQDLVLPKNPMLHILDNFDHSHQSTDDFDINKYPFLNNRTNIKYLHNFIQFDDIDKSFLDKFGHRLYRSKLVENVRAFSLSHRKELIPLIKLDTVVSNKNCVLVENYNPIYRIIATNQRPINQYYRYQAIFSTVLQNTLKYDRQHFLVIPVDDDLNIKRSNIVALAQAEEMSPQRLVNTSHFYFFMLDLAILLLNNESKLTTFSTLALRDISRLNIILIKNGKCIIFNIGKLASLITSNTYVFDFIKTIMRFSSTSQEIVIDDTDESEIDETPVVQSIIPQLKKSFDVGKPSIIKTLIEKEVVTETEIDSFEEEPVQKEARSKNYLLPKTLDTKIISSIPFSDKQKTRIETLADKYKSIKVKTESGERTIEEILNESVDINIQSEQLNVSHNGEVSEDMLASSTIVFDNKYRNQLLHKDILNNVVCFQENGLFLTKYDEKNEYNEFTRVKHVKVGFTDIRGKQHTISFKLPMPDDEGYFLVNGVRLSMSKQLVNVPICKISPTRVSLISNYNKTLVDKVQSVRYSIDAFLAKKADKLGITLVPKLNTYVGINLPYEYKLFGKSYAKILTDTYTFYFEYENRFKFFNNEALKEAENEYGVVVGKLNEGNNQYVFMNKLGILSGVDLNSFNQLKIPKHIVDCFGDFQVPPEWCDLKILDKNIPIGFILSYRYGLSKVLTNLKIQHTFISKASGEKPQPSNTDIVMQFADGWLVINRYPLIHSYIISGLSSFSTLSNYQFIDLDGKDAYYGLISEKGMSMNYLKGIDNYFSFFIDPITKDVLQEMGEPTNTRDLLIRSVELLINENDKAPSSITNFRLRSSEKIPSMIYNEIARQYANYVNSEFKDVSFSINTEAIFQRLIQDETMNLREDINPIHSIKENSRVTHAGFGGRSSQAFVSRDRKYAQDAIGIISEATTDSGSVGMVASLSGNPSIKNVRGMFDTNSDLNTTNILSDVGLLMPSSLHDDQNKVLLISND